VITVCAHPGIIRILQEVQKRWKHTIYLVLGRFHFLRNKQSQIEEIVNQLKALNVQLAAPCHCTGSLAIERFHKEFQDPYTKLELELFLPEANNSGLCLKEKTTIRLV